MERPLKLILSCIGNSARRQASSRLQKGLLEKGGWKGAGGGQTRLRGKGYMDL